MNRPCWWLIETLSRLLEPAEREAVRGDLEESGESAQQVLLELMGLVARRYAAPWMHWKPWVAPLGLVAPYLLLLGGRSIGEPWLGEVTLQVTTLWNYKARYQVGLPVVDDVVNLICITLLMVTWAWLGGFAFGSLARRLAWVHPVLLTFLLWFLGTPAFMLVFSQERPVRTSEALLWVGTAILLLPVPLLAGVYHGSHSITVSVRRTVLLAAGLALLTLIVQIEDGRSHIAYDVWARGESVYQRFVWNPQLFPFAAILWQLGVMGAIARWQRHKATVA